MDLRQNQRGRFVKVTMLAGGKTFIAIPGNLEELEGPSSRVYTASYCR